MGNFAIPGLGRAAYGAETLFRRAETMSRRHGQQLRAEVSGRQRIARRERPVTGDPVPGLFETVPGHLVRWRAHHEQAGGNARSFRLILPASSSERTTQARRFRKWNSGAWNSVSPRSFVRNAAFAVSVKRPTIPSEASVGAAGPPVKRRRASPGDTNSVPVGAGGGRRTVFGGLAHFPNASDRAARLTYVSRETSGAARPGARRRADSAGSRRSRAATSPSR